MIINESTVSFFLDEGVDNEPGEACQTAGAGPHRRQSELKYILANDLE